MNNTTHSHSRHDALLHVADRHIENDEHEKEGQYDFDDKCADKRPGRQCCAKGFMFWK